VLSIKLIDVFIEILMFGVKSNLNIWFESVEQDCRSIEANKEIHLNELPNACGANFQFTMGYSI
jgi:hypothetical protein